MTDDPLVNSFVLPPDGAGPLFLRIHNEVRDAITRGEIAPGSRLPSSRALASDLGVSRTTVVSAYDQLVAEGYAETRPGAGVFACDARPVSGVEPTARPTPPQPRRTPSPPSADPHPLTPGLADLSLFPARSWARNLARVARREPEALHNCPDVFGDAELRHQIAQHLYEWRGFRARPEQIVITGGSGEALERSLELTRVQGGSVGLEDPGYLPVRAYVENRGRPVRWLRVDTEGAVPPRSSPDAPTGTVVLTPSHQFPLGGVMSQARRAAFLRWATLDQRWIIEDDFDSEFRYAGRPIPALAALDRHNRVIYVGSFSKVFSHGLRIGFMVLPDQLIGPALDMLKRDPSRASVLGQRPLARFMENGVYLRHLRRARRIYGRRYSALMRALDEHLGHVAQYGRHNAGMLLACHLPPTLPERQIVQIAHAEGLGCASLSQYAAKPGLVNGVLLGFCATPDEVIPQAVKRLSDIIERQK